jgi:hypothetical protein
VLDAEHLGDRGAHRTTICAPHRALRLVQATAAAGQRTPA